MSIAESTERNAAQISLADEENVKQVLVNSVLGLWDVVNIWQLLQVRHLRDTPLILVGKMWPGLVKWAQGAMLSCDPPLAKAEDMAIPRCVDTADEAIELVREEHQKWQGNTILSSLRKVSA